MPKISEKLLYDNAVKWMRENPEDKSLPEALKQAFLNFDSLTADKQAELLKSLLERSGLPEQIKASLPYLTADLDAFPLPYEIILEIKERLSASDITNAGLASKSMQVLFHDPNKIPNKFLERVAFGMQDKAEQLFTDVYSFDAAKIQKALRYQGQFTDYSGRTFNCTAYEYAYWAKDTHMCRMLERYMDEATKAQMLVRIDAMDANGLAYQQNGQEHRSAHFDFTPLIEAYQRYIDGEHLVATPLNLAARKAAWLDVGKAQRNVPAHVAQEYCRLDRSFDPTPEFNEATLPRTLPRNYYDDWFPLAAPNSGLGFDFAFKRGWEQNCSSESGEGPIEGKIQDEDLAAVRRLDEVRTNDLLQSREHLNPPAISMQVPFQRPNIVLAKFLERVAFGMQDKVEQIFTEVYLGDAAKIQKALRYQGQFTDYSGRTFNCSAYEYAYWAKDTHMCRMLERYMDEATKAQMLVRIDAMDANGLAYQQNGQEHRSAHFDFTPLIEAYQRYIDGEHLVATPLNLAARKAAWLDVGKAQRNVPAHVAQEYCRSDRSFDPTLEFNEATLPRELTFYDWGSYRKLNWFPLGASNSGLGFDFALERKQDYVSSLDHRQLTYCKFPVENLAAVRRLDEVRTNDLVQSREHLNPPAQSCNVM